MDVKKINHLHEYRQGIWLDFIDREIVRSATLQRQIAEDGIRGIMPDLAVLEKAVFDSSDYGEEIKRLTLEHLNNEGIFFRLADMWDKVARKNLMIKIPGTEPCLPAIQKAIKAGLNINVTLLFGLDRYEAVAEAYISGLEDRVSAGEQISQIASVASFLLSRAVLMTYLTHEEKNFADLNCEAATASAIKAGQIYKRVFNTDRWKKLEEKGARPQLLFWVSN